MASWMGSTTRCILLNQNETRASPATSSSSASRNSDGAEWKEADDGFRCWPRRFWVTDWVTVCTHLYCSVKKCRLLRRHSLCCLLLLLLLPHLSVSECESDSRLEGYAVASTRCLRHMQLCLSPPSLTLFCLCHTLLQYSVGPPSNSLFHSPEELVQFPKETESQAFSCLSTIARTKNPRSLQRTMNLVEVKRWISQ